MYSDLVSGQTETEGDRQDVEHPERGVSRN